MKQNCFESMTLVSGFMEVPVDRHSGQIGSFLRKRFPGPSVFVGGYFPDPVHLFNISFDRCEGRSSLHQKCGDLV